MKAEIIAIGTELLIGDVINTNAAWLSQELAALGVDVFYHVTVGDNPARIQGILAQALSRSDIILFTGGLGPTEDDLTIAAIADYFHVPLTLDPQSAEKIRAYIIARGMPMSANNIKQALKPEGAETIPNPIGTAPGIYWDLSEKQGKPTYILTFPGVPKELYAMWPFAQERLRTLQQASGERKAILIHRFLLFFGIGESKLAEILSDLMAADNPTVAPYVGRAEVKIRITAKASGASEAYAAIAPVQDEIMRRCGQYCFGQDEDTLESVVADLLCKKNMTLAVAESCTGGLVSSRLTDIDGSSQYIRFNTVTYSNTHKEQILSVPKALLETHGAVSAEVAAAMAAGIQKASGCHIGLSLTGIAGPSGGSEEKPVGLVYIGLCSLSDQPVTHKVLVNPNYSRLDIKFWFSQYALHYLRLYLLNG